MRSGAFAHFGSQGGGCFLKNFSIFGVVANPGIPPKGTGLAPIKTAGNGMPGTAGSLPSTIGKIPTFSKASAIAEASLFFAPVGAYIVIPAPVPGIGNSFQKRGGLLEVSSINSTVTPACFITAPIEKTYVDESGSSDGYKYTVLTLPRIASAIIFICAFVRSRCLSWSTIACRAFSSAARAAFARFSAFSSRAISRSISDVLSWMYLSNPPSFSMAKVASIVALVASLCVFACSNSLETRKKVSAVAPFSSAQNSHATPITITALPRNVSQWYTRIFSPFFQFSLTSSTVAATSNATPITTAIVASWRLVAQKSAAPSSMFFRAWNAVNISSGDKCANESLDQFKWRIAATTFVLLLAFGAVLLITAVILFCMWLQGK